MEGVRRVPYRLPELVAAPSDAVIYIVEGEKDADRLAGEGLVATTNPGGASKGKSKWRGEYNTHFAGRRVVVIPDNDEAGRAHAQTIARQLGPIASGVHVLELPGLLNKGEDVSNWLDNGGTRVELERLAGEAIAEPDKEAEQDSAEEEQIGAEICRLATLSPIKYELARAEAAQKLGSRVTVLDKLVKTERGIGDDVGQGRPVNIPDVEPWSEPVDGAVVLAELAAAVHKYTILSDAEADATALWVVRTHAHDAFDFHPPLWVKSAEPRSGKTRLCAMVKRVAAKALLVSSVSASALLRVVETARPTLLLDELDALMGKGPELAEAVRGLINSSFERGDSGHLISVPVPGGGYEARQFSMWTPLMLSGIGELPQTVRDRAIVIEMKRKRRDEKVARLRQRDGQDLQMLGRKAARWAQDNVIALGAGRPEMPEWLDDRACDGWESLFAIAELAGKGWRERAEKAAQALSGSDATEGGSYRIKVLSDIRSLFAEKKADRLSSKDIVKHLAELEDGPWAEWGKQRKPISKNQLASLLRPLHITPGTVRLENSRTPKKGYSLDQFKDTFARYLPPSPLLDRYNVTSLENVRVSGENQTVTDDPLLRSENPHSGSVSATCVVVPVQNRDSPPLRDNDTDFGGRGIPFDGPGRTASHAGNELSPDASKSGRTTL
jgi:putative DNA primase/helicase